MDDLVRAAQEDLKSLKATIKKRYSVSVERAKAENTYRTALGRAMAIAKSDGMAATALYDYCRGLEDIANLRANRDIAQAQEEYLTEMIYFYRTEIRVAEGMMQAERKGM